MARKKISGIFLALIAILIFAPNLTFGAVVWGTGVTLPSSPVYGQSNPYILAEGAFSGGFTVDSLEIGSRHWNCGGAQHNEGYVTITNATSGVTYATSSNFSQYCGGDSNPDNISVTFSGENIPSSTILQIQIHYTLWVGDNGYGGFAMQGNLTPEIAILSPADNVEISTTGMLTPWSVYNSIASSTITGVSIYPVLQYPTTQNTQSAEVNSTGTVSVTDSFSYTPQPYYAYAYAKNSSGVIIATSTLIHIYPSAPDDTTTSTAYSTCDSDGSSFTGRWFCRSMVFLFTPSQSVMNNFTNLRTRAEGVPPFNILAEVRSAMEINSTSSEELVSSTTTQALSEVFSPMRTGIKVALWLMFAFWLIRLTRNIQA